jgi:serine O-acetyltransferase
MIRHLVKIRSIPGLRYISYFAMKLLGVEIPPSVRIGRNLVLPHWSNGTVIHSNTTIGNNVRIYQQVTVGRADIYNNSSQVESITIEDDVILCAGAKLLAKKSCVIESGTILGANSVLIVKTDRVESGIYAGIPAKRIR